MKDDERKKRDESRKRFLLFCLCLRVVCNNDVFWSACMLFYQGTPPIQAKRLEIPTTCASNKTTTSGQHQSRRRLTSIRPCLWRHVCSRVSRVQDNIRTSYDRVGLKDPQFSTLIFTILSVFAFAKTGRCTSTLERQEDISIPPRITRRGCFLHFGRGSVRNAIRAIIARVPFKSMGNQRYVLSP
ncbi:hypothetical protein BC939DRAFT_268483 [Gamsiella multidivaricata]|uniref:uncharacterized protein n=1 Tax=Gamsiella multidivaricata TaxID=101098 RepID=UPI002220E8C6|nr:uncharacterized protein BC939DRAFT_268483 [Gamsiella multidivaricata]KAI7819242.1 hypothetical protein BC939DRAFT_268483 [Gamsiella multidivaricata]